MQGTETTSKVQYFNGEETITLEVDVNGVQEIYFDWDTKLITYVNESGENICIISPYLKINE